MFQRQHPSGRGTEPCLVLAQSVLLTNGTAKHPAGGDEDEPRHLLLPHSQGEPAVHNRTVPGVRRAGQDSHTALLLAATSSPRLRMGRGQLGVLEDKTFASLKVRVKQTHLPRHHFPQLPVRPS